MKNLATKATAPKVDVDVGDHGTFFLFTSHTETAENWIGGQRHGRDEVEHAEENETVEPKA